MRFDGKIKMCIVAVAMASAGAAQAGIDNVGDGATSRGGELFVTAWDRAAKKGYFFDLGGEIGRTTGGLLLGGWNNLANQSVDLTAVGGWNNFVSLLGATGLSNVKWMVGSSSNHYGPDSDNGLYRAVETTATTVGTLGQDYQIMQGFFETFSNSVNGQTGLTPTNESFNESFSTGTVGAVYNPAEPGWSNGWSNSFPGVVSANLGNEMDMYRYGANATEDPEQPASLEKYAGVWKLTAAGMLTYTVAEVTPVPVPAAVWLLATALVGMAGIGRRSREEPNLA